MPPRNNSEKDADSVSLSLARLSSLWRLSLFGFSFPLFRLGHLLVVRYLTLFSVPLLSPSLLHYIYLLPLLSSSFFFTSVYNESCINLLTKVQYFHHKIPQRAPLHAQYTLVALSVFTSSPHQYLQSFLSLFFSSTTPSHSTPTCPIFFSPFLVPQPSRIPLSSFSEINITLSFQRKGVIIRPDV